MNRACIVSFHQYQPQGRTEHYRNFFEYFKKTLRIWGKEIDKLYIVDQDWNFTLKDKDDLKELTNDFEIFQSVNQGHHWQQFLDLLPRVKEENVMVIDNDMFIYKKGLVDEKFKMLESGYDLVSMFDGSGGMREKIWENFPALKVKDYIRLGPYLCFIKRKLLDNFDGEPKYYKPGVYIKELDYTTGESDWLDSFGEMTLKILSTNPKMEFIDDDRTSLFFYPDHTIGTIYQQEPTGCYHVRNWNLGLHFINERKNSRENYDHFKSITPIQESFRLLGWLWAVSEATGNLNSNLTEDILEVVRDYGATDDEWARYIIGFKELHKWLKLSSRDL